MSGSLRLFEEFFADEQERLLRILWVVCGSQEEAEEIVQDAFLKVWERWERVSVMESPTGYLHRTAMNVFRSRYRRASVAVRKAVSAGPAADLYAVADDRLAVRSALRSLTPRQRAALVLTELLGHTPEEAGRMLGVRPSTIRSLTSSGRAALREAKEFVDD